MLTVWQPVRQTQRAQEPKRKTPSHSVFNLRTGRTAQQSVSGRSSMISNPGKQQSWPSFCLIQEQHEIHLPWPLVPFEESSSQRMGHLTTFPGGSKNLVEGTYGSPGTTVTLVEDVQTHSKLIEMQNRLAQARKACRQAICSPA